MSIFIYSLSLYPVRWGARREGIISVDTYAMIISSIGDGIRDDILLSGRSTNIFVGYQRCDMNMEAEVEHTDHISPIKVSGGILMNL